MDLSPRCCDCLRVTHPDDLEPVTDARGDLTGFRCEECRDQRALAAQVEEGADPATVAILLALPRTPAANYLPEHLGGQTIARRVA